LARILVTGGAGFIGSHLIDRLLDRGDDVVVVDDFSLGAREKLGPNAARVQWIDAPVQRIGEHRAEIDQVDRIFHLAALISGYDSLNAADAYVDANVTGMLRVLELARDLGGTRILFASSSTVYGDRPDPVRRETDVPAPITVYAATKLLGEHLLAMYAPLYGFTHTSLRLFNVYGPRQNPDHPYANVTCKFAFAAANHTGVRLYGDGLQTRDFVYVSDVVDAFLAVEAGSEQAAYNVGTGADAPILSLLEHVQRAVGAELPVERLGAWHNDIRAIRADCSRLTAETGWAPKVSLGEGLRRTVAFFQGAR
jgi:UDP-glucose 4-epimerase